MRRFTSGFKSAQKSFSKPVRITPTTRPGNPIQGLEGITGAEAISVFGKPVGKFGRNPKKALQAKSRVRGNR